MKKSRTDLDDEMRPEYDFAKMRGGVRGKHAGADARVRLVQLDGDVAAAFPTAAAVNDTLRSAMKARPRSAPKSRTARAGAGITRLRRPRG